jgi:hypothetical protein
LFLQECFVQKSRSLFAIALTLAVTAAGVSAAQAAAPAPTPVVKHVLSVPAQNPSPAFRHLFDARRPGATPAATATSGYLAAFVGTNGSLYTYSPASGLVDLSYAVAAGTSPAVAASPDGGYEIAFNAPNGYLYTYGSTGLVNTFQTIQAGTSPGITGLYGATGGYQIAYHHTDGALWVYGAAGDANTTEGILAGTSPAIADSPLGGYLVDFVADTNLLYTWSSAGHYFNTSQGLWPGTNPAITALSGPVNAYELTFEARTASKLIMYGTAVQVNTQLTMKAGTDSSISTAPNGQSVEVAFQASDGDLETYSNTSGETYPGLSMAADASPAITTIASAAGGGYEIAYETSSGDFATYGISSEGSVNTLQGVKADTNPSIA